MSWPRGLKADAVRLDTALMFSEFRDTATADERRRLAREMHDGVAQDIASLGYLVDALAARPATPQQADQFQVLRERISHVVAEVRQSVLTLRTSVGESESLGAAISSVARNLSEVSGIPIHVTLDEHTTRLRPAVEAELYRITPGSHEQRDQARPGDRDQRALPGARARRLDHRSPTTAAACSRPAATTRTACRSCRSGPGWSTPSSRSTTNAGGGLAVRVRISGDEPSQPRQQ